MGSIIIIAIVIIWICYRQYSINQMQQITSSIDGLRYKVHKNLTWPNKAADILAQINIIIIKLLRYLRDQPNSGARATIVQNLLKRYNPDNLIEHSPRKIGSDTSYTLNKGELIALCLRERDPKSMGDPSIYDFHEFNTLVFVALHELTHIAIDELGHSQTFWMTFRFLLEAAEDAKIYISPDYEKNPQHYCGVLINYNPRYDTSLPNILHF